MFILTALLKTEIYTIHSVIKIQHNFLNTVVPPLLRKPFLQYKGGSIRQDVSPKGDNLVVFYYVWPLVGVTL